MIISQDFIKIFEISKRFEFLGYIVIKERSRKKIYPKKPNTRMLIKVHIYNNRIKYILNNFFFFFVGKISLEMEMKSAFKVSKYKLYNNVKVKLTEEKISHYMPKSKVFV